jgi:hypothetical protein
MSRVQNPRTAKKFLKEFRGSAFSLKTAQFETAPTALREEVGSYTHIRYRN